MCPSPVQYFVIYALVGISIAFLLVRQQKGTDFKFSMYNVSVSIVGGAAIPLALFVINPIGQFKSDKCLGLARVTVFVHGKGGRADVVLRSQGRVLMDIDGERKSSAIDQDGQAHFINIPTGSHGFLDIEFSEPYHPVNPDSAYLIESDISIYLKVSLRGIDKIEGTVLYDSQPLPGVLVKMKSLETYTATAGNFSLTVPDSLQKAKYDIQLIKEGFDVMLVAVFPQTEQAPIFTMKKR